MASGGRRLSPSRRRQREDLAPRASTASAASGPTGPQPQLGALAGRPGRRGTGCCDRLTQSSSVLSDLEDLGTRSAPPRVTKSPAGLADAGPARWPPRRTSPPRCRINRGPSGSSSLATEMLRCPYFLTKCGQLLERKLVASVSVASLISIGRLHARHHLHVVFVQEGEADVRGRASEHIRQHQHAFALIGCSASATEMALAHLVDALGRLHRRPRRELRRHRARSASERLEKHLAQAIVGHDDDADPTHTFALPRHRGLSRDVRGAPRAASLPKRSSPGRSTMATERCRPPVQPIGDVDVGLALAGRRGAAGYSNELAEPCERIPEPRALSST